MKRSRRFALGARASIGFLLIGMVLYFYFMEFRMVKFKDPKGRFTIMYPVKWETKTFTNKILPAVTFISPLEHKGDIYQENISVIVTPIPEEEEHNLDSYTAKVFEQMSFLFGPLHMVEESKRTSLAGRPAHRMVFVIFSEVMEIKFMVTWTIKNQVAYQVSYAAIESKFEDFIKKAELMTASLNIPDESAK